MARNPLFTVTFDLTRSSRDDYGAFIAGIRARLGNPRHVSHGRPVLPPVEPGIPPRRWFHVVLKTPASALTLATRADNLDLAGFQSSDGTWWELSDGRKRGAMVCVTRGSRGLIPGSSSLGFGGTYRDLVGGAREAIEFAVGRQQMTEAVDALAAHTAEADIAPYGAERQALVVLRYMVHEATRFLDVSAAIAGLMRSPDVGTTKSIKLTLKGSPEDLGWEWSSSLLLSADSLSGRSRGDYGRTYPAAWERGDCLARAVARVGILLFVATEYGIKAKRVLRLFDGDLCRRAGTDGGAATVQAKEDVRFLVSGVSVAAHRYILAGKSVVFLRQFFYGIRDKSPCVEVKDMDAAVFKAMIHFIYTDKVPEFDQEQPGMEAVAVFAHHLLGAAHRYEVDGLKLICKRKLQSGAIYVGMAATTLALAEQHNYRRLKAMCIDFIVSTRENLHAVLATEGYKHLEASYPSVLTQLLKSVRVTARVSWEIQT
jgi:speckle-type POZ protein